jgi:hypothetical protein
LVRLKDFNGFSSELNVFVDIPDTHQFQPPKTLTFAGSDFDAHPTERRFEYPRQPNG